VKNEEIVKEEISLYVKLKDRALAISTIFSNIC